MADPNHPHGGRFYASRGLGINLPGSNRARNRNNTPPIRDGVAPATSSPEEDFIPLGTEADFEGEDDDDDDRSYEWFECQLYFARQNELLDSPGGAFGPNAAPPPTVVADANSIPGLVARTAAAGRGAGRAPAAVVADANSIPGIVARAAAARAAVVADASSIPAAVARASAASAASAALADASIPADCFATDDGDEGGDYEWDSSSTSSEGDDDDGEGGGGVQLEPAPETTPLPPRSEPDRRRRRFRRHRGHAHDGGTPMLALAIRNWRANRDAVFAKKLQADLIEQEERLENLGHPRLATAGARKEEIQPTEDEDTDVAMSG